ncbi:hypothetical protein N4G70_13730 [Streptomyces sp. ASQP_92]|uniref:hypothetical protein n=1 Tax=Streptomyces sp. ASQP_92 TaxID=2979116 RepID=UPI0021C1C452|nr:hypothetical protein [Streptomyces sp. ASQP_92]MCT9089923.1 hypothetical protein [Streptomyces sp. ASQP_92]
MSLARRVKSGELLGEQAHQDDIAVLTAGEDTGNISRNTEDGYDLYKASKAALNQLMRSYATRHADEATPSC